MKIYTWGKQGHRHDTYKKPEVLWAQDKNKQESIDGENL